MIFIHFTVAIELIVQHIRDFLNNRGRCIEQESQQIFEKTNVSQESGSEPQTHGKKIDNSHNMHRPH